MAEAQVKEELVAELETLLATETDSAAQTSTEMALALARPFDPKVRKPKQGFTYIPAAVIRRRVNNVTGGNYTWDILEETFRNGDEISVTGLIHKVRGRLTIPGLGFRDGIGTAVIRKGSEEQYKSADTDAFKRAAMAFGVALELYPGDLEVLDGEEEAPKPKAAPRAAKTPTPISTPSAPVELDIDTLLAQEKARISASKMKDFTKQMGWPAQRLPELTPEQKVELLTWSRTQPNREDTVTATAA